MGKLFGIESPVIKICERATDLMIVNVLMLICCIPIVTIGASYTAMYSVILKMQKKELTYVVKEFFGAFRKNFKEATLLWLLYLVIGIILVADYLCLWSINTMVIKCLIYAITALVLISLAWSFTLVSRYENSLKRTIVNAVLIGISNIVKTIVGGLLALIPLALFILCPWSVPIVLLVGVSLTSYLQTIVYRPVLDTLEKSLQ